MGLSASHHMCSVVGAELKRDGGRSNFLHKSARHGFQSEDLKGTDILPLLK